MELRPIYSRKGRSSINIVPLFVYSLHIRSVLPSACGGTPPVDSGRRGCLNGVMYALGIDVGTTNLNASLVDLETGRVAERRSAPNLRLASEDGYAYQQDPAGIAAAVREMLASLKQPVGAVCVTGQVHGILYVDDSGRPLSPLYNWLDRRGTEVMDGTTFQKRLAERTGQTLPAGYGLLTHYANRLSGKVPVGARRILGINEFVTGILTGAMPDRTDASNLGPFGGFDPVSGTRDPRLMAEVLPSGSPAFPDLAPPFALAGATVAGSGLPAGIPVAYPVGDNQAGFFGLVARPTRSALLSIGTSGQISVFSPSEACSPGMELRPYLGLGYLHVGATLCAGKSYEVVERFLKGILDAAGVAGADDEAVFRLMRRAAEASAAPAALSFDTALNGTRLDGARRGSILGIGMDNLNLGNLVRATVEGIVRELADFRAGRGALFDGLDSIVATGSAVRKNPLFAEALRRQFALDIRVPAVDGGAALGVALIGAVAAGILLLRDVEGLVDAASNPA